MIQSHAINHRLVSLLSRVTTRRIEWFLCGLFTHVLNETSQPSRVAKFIRARISYADDGAPSDGSFTGERLYINKFESRARFSIITFQ